MKTMLKGGIMLMILLSNISLFAQKKVQNFTVVHVINAPIEQVWTVLAEDFDNVSHYHHGFVSSSFIGGTTQAGEGALRISYLNEEKNRFIKERQINYDPSGFSFEVEVIEGKGLPLASGKNIASYKLSPINESSCRLSIEVNMRSEPAIFSSLFKGQYQEWMEKFAIGVHHYVLTGEEIGKENFNEIEKLYR